MACNCETPDCPTSTPENESLPSAVDNLIKAFFGTLTKTLDGDGKVVWTLPCDLEAGIEGHPRIEGEGLACYFSRVFAEGITGLDGQDAFAVTTEDFVQPAVDANVVVSVSTTAPFAAGQHVWGSTGGYYSVVSIGSGTVTLRNLYGPPNNLSAGITVATGAKILPSGVPETSGPQGAPGDDGAPGEDGAAAYFYMAFASDSSGAGFTTIFNPSLDYVAFRATTSPIVSPAGSDFTGLWKKYKGDDGPPGSEPERFWIFNAVGTHYWVCPAGVTSVRVKVYGGGGGGGGGGSTANGSGDGFGGGGGEYAERSVTVVPGTEYQALVGGGGAGGTGGDADADGDDGSETSFFDAFTTFITAKGGIGGGDSIGGAVGAGGAGGSGTATLRLSGFDAILSRGGHCAREGVGGLPDGEGESPGGGGGAGIGDAGGAGAPGQDGAAGRVVIEVIG